MMMTIEEPVHKSYSDASIEETLKTQLLRYVDRLVPLSVGPETTLLETVQLMRKESVDSVLVTENESLLGIFTDRDYLDKIAGGLVAPDTPVRAVMTADPVTLTLNDSMADLIRTIVDDGFRHVPVQDEQGKIVGIYTALAVVRYIAEHFPTEILNLPDGPGRHLSSPEGG